MPTFIADDAFDQQFSRTLNATTRGCADLGEAIAVAARITPGDVTSWSDEWTAAGQRTRAEADAAQEAGDLAGARRAYLRASEYFRQAFFSSPRGRAVTARGSARTCSTSTSTAGWPAC